MVYRVVYHYCFSDTEVTVRADSESDAIWQAFRESSIKDWYIFRRFVQGVRKA